MKQVEKLIEFVREILAFLKPMQIPLHGAYTGFFLILSLFPGLVLLFAVLGYTSYGVEEVLALVENILPQALMSLAQPMLIDAYAHTSGAVLSVSLIAALWSAGRGMGGLMQGINAVYGLKENRSYLVKRSIGAVYTLLFLPVLVLTLVLHVFGNMILDYLRMTTIPLLQVLMDLIDLRFLFLLILQTALFTAIYAVLPNRNNGIKESLPGALLATIGWLTFTNLFSLYVTYFPGYTNIFGSVYAMALAMLWLYFCICIIFYGGALNRYLSEKNAK